jgi:hypothetical protein
LLKFPPTFIMSQALIRTLNHKLALYLGINTMELYVDIHIWVTKASLETADPLYQQKRIIVQRNNRLTVQTFQVLVPAFETTSLALRHCCLSFLPLLLIFKP